jgi:hypothetical protein
VCFVKLRNDNRVLFFKSGLMELIGKYLFGVEVIVCRS